MVSETRENITISHEEINAFVILTCHGCPPTGEFLQPEILGKNPVPRTVSVLFTSSARLPHFSPVWQREHRCVCTRTLSTSCKDSLCQDSSSDFPGLARTFWHHSAAGSPPSFLKIFLRLSHNYPMLTGTCFRAPRSFTAWAALLRPRGGRRPPPPPPDPFRAYFGRKHDRI